MSRTLYTDAGGQAGFTLSAGTDCRMYFSLNLATGLPPSADSDNWRRSLHHEYPHVINIPAAAAAASTAMQATWTAQNAQAYGSGWVIGSADDPTSFVDFVGIPYYAEDQAQVHSVLMAQPRYS